MCENACTVLVASVPFNSLFLHAVYPINIFCFKDYISTEIA